MKAILQYVQKVIASGKNGTISIMIDTGEAATLTVKNRAIVAATLDDTTGKVALEAIKLANIKHMEFWPDITQKSDVRRMIKLQTETNALAPLPEEEMHPEGATISIDSENSSKVSDDSDTAHNSESKDSHDEMSGKSDDQSTQNAEKKADSETKEPLTLSEQEANALSRALAEYIGPAADILVETVADQSQNIDHMIEILCEDLYSEKECESFRRRAYFLLGKTP